MVNEPEARLQIESLDQLRIAAQQPVEAYILLGAGAVRSNKQIHYEHSRNGRHWWMYEDVSDTERYYTERQFANNTNIVEAIGKGALYIMVDRLPDRPESEEG